jgi:hypothetical protein
MTEKIQKNTKEGKNRGVMQKKDRKNVLSIKKQGVK